VCIPPLQAQLQGLILTLFPKMALPGVVRVSLGIESCEEDVDALVDVLGQIARQPRAGAGRHAAPTRDGTSRLTQAEVRQQMDDFVRAAAQRVYALSD
jgi:hypothetical protein